MVDVIIERVQVTNVKSARATVALSFPLSAHTSELFTMLAEQTGNPMRVSFETIAQQLGFGDDPNAGVEPEGAHMWASTTGDVVAAHGFEASPEHTGACFQCGHGQTHPCHSSAEILQRQARETPATEPTEEQQAARERLATTAGRGKRNGAAAGEAEA